MKVLAVLLLLSLCALLAWIWRLAMVNLHAPMRLTVEPEAYELLAARKKNFVIIPLAALCTAPFSEPVRLSRIATSKIVGGRLFIESRCSSRILEAVTISMLLGTGTALVLDSSLYKRLGYASSSLLEQELITLTRRFSDEIFAVVFLSGVA